MEIDTILYSDTELYQQLGLYGKISIYGIESFQLFLTSRLTKEKFFRSADQKGGINNAERQES